MRRDRRQNWGWGGWWGLLVCVALFTNPLLYDVHLIVEPHIYCPVHGRLESRLDPHTGNTWPGEPADPREHENADVACLLVHLACGGEEARDCTPSLVPRVTEQPIPRVQDSPFVATKVLALAPKQSPPDPVSMV